MTPRTTAGGRERRPNRGSGAVQARAGAAQRLRAWVLEHRLVAQDALGRLSAQPVASLLTCLVVGIALALPAGLFVGLDNLQRLTAGWDGGARMSVFLRDSVTEQQGRALGAQLSARSGVAGVRYISRAQALQEFRHLSGFGDLLDAMPGNPLPATLVVTPLLAVGHEGMLRALAEQMSERAEVERVQLDVQWVQRLYALLALARQATLSMAMLLGIGVLLVTGNTIRLAIENRRQEIVVAKLVGGTDAFVRRPFIYTGFWYGLGGGVIAWLLVASLLYLLASPVEALAALYGSTFRLVGFSFGDFFALLIGGAVLGWGGAWLAVSHHLGAIVPR